MISRGLNSERASQPCTAAHALLGGPDSPDLAVGVAEAREHRRNDLLQIGRNLDTQRDADAGEADEATAARMVVLRAARCEQGAELLHYEVDAGAISADQRLANLPSDGGKRVRWVIPCVLRHSSALLEVQRGRLAAVIHAVQQGLL